MTTGQIGLAAYRRGAGLAVILVIAGTLAGGAVAVGQPSPGVYEIPESEPVVLGNYPVFDLGPWVAAEHWGYLDDLKLTLEHRVFPDERTGLAALAGGTSQLQLMGLVSLAGVKPTFPDFQNVFQPEVFMGFAPLVRPDGGLKTFEQLSQEIADPAEAKQATCAQVAGKTWLMQLGASHEPVLDAVLECAGLTRDDLTLIDIGPAEGAAAFIRGEGDIYLGDVPNRFRLEEEGMLPLISAFDLGPKATDFVAIVANEPWIAEPENEDTLMRLMAAWYRALDDLLVGDARSDEGWQAIADWVNEGAGTSFDKEAARFVLTTISPPVPADDMLRTFYTPGEPWYLPDRAAFDVQTREDQGAVDPGEVDPATLDMSQELFEKYLDQRRQAEEGIASGHPNGELAQRFLDERNYLDAARAVAGE
jgi:ABC-type nitrate/sulfonate/bicarbonate transport system substrate-binding protein